MIICDICKKDISNKTVNRGWGYTLCCKHYQQRLKHGHFLDSNPYSINDANEFRIEGDISYIKLCKKNGDFVAEAIIDTKFLDKLIVYKWRFWQGRVFTGNYNPISMPYMVLDIEKGGNQNLLVIDHINGNPLDNREENLRIVTQKENSLNKEILSNNHSGFLGVFYDGNRDKWCSEIRYEKKKCYLGRYGRKIEAVYARYLAEIWLWGEYRSTRNDEEILKQTQKCQNKTYIEQYVKHRLEDIYKIKIDVSTTL